jgi:hypothetical protein
LRQARLRLIQTTRQIVLIGAGSRPTPHQDLAATDGERDVWIRAGINHETSMVKQTLKIELN